MFFFLSEKVDIHHNTNSHENLSSIQRFKKVLLLISVDCGTPTPQLSYYQACSELASFHYPYPTTVGAFVKFSCESLLIRTRAPEDYCPLMVCQPNGLWTAAKLTCGGGRL